MKNLSIGIGFVLSLSTMVFFAHRNQQKILKNERELKQIQFISRNDINIVNADTIQYHHQDTLKTR